MSELSEAMFDHSLHVEIAIHVPTMLAGEPSDRVAEAIRDGDMDQAAPLLGITADVLAAGVKEEELGWLLRDVDGWLVEVSTPRVGPWSLDEDGNRRGRRLYTGWRTMRWFKADTYEAALDAAVEWVASDPDQLVVQPTTGGSKSHD